MAGIPDGYVTVPERIAEFKALYPSGCFQPAYPDRPWEVLVIGGQYFIAYAAAAYRTPDDDRPGIGVAWEPVPGPTNFTKNSELQNAETSAWGRAIVAVLAADAKKGIATADEVRNRAAEADAPENFGSTTDRVCSSCKKPLVAGVALAADGAGGWKHKAPCVVPPAAGVESAAPRDTAVAT